MMRTFLGAIVAVLAVAQPVTSFAADPYGRPPPRAGASRPGPRHFDPAAITTVSGEITAVHRFDGRRDDGVHVDLKTAEGVLDVHLGPSSYLESQKLRLAVGDLVEVTGAKLQRRAKPALIAQSVKKGDSTVTLRDAQGIPAWARRGRR